MSEDDFFKVSTHGGTLISSCLDLELEIIEKEFHPNSWNIYSFYCGDGENWSADNEKCLDLFKQIKANKNGRIETWSIYWYASTYLENGLSLHPSQSFVSNIGHDGTGAHCAKTSIYDVDLVANYSIAFTSQIKEDKIARVSLENYFNSSKVPFIIRVLNRLNKFYEKNIKKYFY